MPEFLEQAAEQAVGSNYGPAGGRFASKDIRVSGGRLPMDVHADQWLCLCSQFQGGGRGRHKDNGFGGDSSGFGNDTGGFGGFEESNTGGFSAPADVEADEW